MKPKLLITLGCSWTEGVGCQNPHKDNWPRKLGKKLGFDRVINIGKGGWSNSGQVKLLYDYLSKNNLDDYEVLVIFLMIEPTRFSFYVNQSVQNYNALFDIRKGKRFSISENYIDIISDIEVDPTLEQVFYVRSLEFICKSKNFDLLVTTWVDNSKLFFKIYENSSINLFSTPRYLRPPNYENSNYYAPCSHPNELGYGWMSNEMVKGIKENHPKWYSEIPNPNMKYEWKGEYRAYSYKNII